MLLSCLTNEHGFCWGRHHKWWPWWCSWSALIAHTCKSQVSANQMPRMIHMVILLELATGDRLVPSFQAVVSVFYSSIPCHTSTWHFVAYILETSWNKCIVAIQTKCRIQIETWLEINSFHVDFWEEATIMVNDQFFYLYSNGLSPENKVHLDSWGFGLQTRDHSYNVPHPGHWGIDLVFIHHPAVTVPMVEVVEVVEWRGKEEQNLTKYRQR